MALDSNGWTIWQRAATNITITAAMSTGTVTSNVAAAPNAEVRFEDGTTMAQIAAAIAAGNNPLAFECGGEWDDIVIPSLGNRDYVAWYGTPSDGRPIFNGNEVSNTIKIVPGNSVYGSLLITGIEFAGGTNPGDDYRAIEMVLTQNQTGSIDLIVEDCKIHHYNTAIHARDDWSRNNAGAPGTFTLTARRNIIYNIDGESTHSVGIYIEGSADSSLVEQNTIDQVGYTSTRSEDDRRGASKGPNPNKAEHGVYCQSFGGTSIIRYNFFSRIAAFSSQLRQGGQFWYNSSWKTGNTVNGLNGELHVKGSVWSFNEDISPAERSGKGIEAYDKNPRVEECVLFNAQHSNVNQAVIIVSGSSPKMFNNVAANFNNINTSQGTFRRNGVEYLGRADDTNVAGNTRIEKSGDYNWTTDSAAKIEIRKARGLGQWRPAVDHPGTDINSVRSSAQAAAVAAGGTTSLPAVTFLLNGETEGGGSTTPGGGSGPIETPDEIPFSIEVASPIITIQLPTDSANLVATVLGDSEASVDTVAYEWSQSAGPTQVSITDATTLNASVTGLIAGGYEFEVAAEVTYTDTSQTEFYRTVYVNVLAADVPDEPGPVEPTAIPQWIEAVGYKARIQIGEAVETLATAGVTSTWTLEGGPRKANIKTIEARSFGQAIAEVSKAGPGEYRLRHTFEDGESNTLVTDVTLVFYSPSLALVK